MDWKRGLQQAFLYLSIITMETRGHPQCLDAEPPFSAGNPHNFCSRYSDFGCCTTAQDGHLQEKFNTIKNLISLECQTYLKDIMCLECSPYAAHLFDFEGTLVKKPLPGLCTSYCQKAYDECAAMFTKLTNDTAITNSLSNRDDFCEELRLGDMDYCYPDLLTNDFLNTKISPAGRTEEGCLCLETFAQGLSNPVIFEYPPDGTDRIFIGEQVGIIHIYHKSNKTKLKEPFVDIRHLVLTSDFKGDERGLLGLAFHPEYKTNRKLYLYYSMYNTERTSQKIRVGEFKASVTNPNKLDQASERVILDVGQPYSNHNGGEIFFGLLDGMLYLSLGDGGYKGDPFDNAQDKTNLLGKILRVNVDTGDVYVPYTIPSDNPFVNEEGSKGEIWAWGLRNAWRCDQDEGHPQTGYGRGRIICADVGQNAYEEVDLIVKGGNYGWDAREGFACYDQQKCGKIGEEELPIFAYPHAVGKSVIGGHVYRGCAYPNLDGQYIYGDFMSGGLYKLTEVMENGKSTWKNISDIHLCGKDVCLQQHGLVDQYEKSILSFGEDREGEIYMLTTDFASTTQKGGKVYKIMDPRRRRDPAECLRRHQKDTETTRLPTTATEILIRTDPGDQTSGPTTPPVVQGPGDGASHPRPGVMVILLVAMVIFLPALWS